MPAQPLTDPTRDTRERVRELDEKGLSPREIAHLLNISTQRVYQHLKAIEKERAAS